MDEAAIIAAVADAFGPLVAPGAYGFEDDAAALPPAAIGGTRVITTDVMVEGVDFDLSLYPPEYVGIRALAQNLSDLSAMGAWPVGFVWSIALPDSWLDPQLARLRALAAGAAHLAAQWQAPLFGGDLSKTTGPLVVSITALGDTRGPPVRRAGARPGDALWLSGPVGASARGLRLLRTRDSHVTSFDAWLRALPEVDAAQVRAHIAPAPADPQILAGATAAIDVSDGLALDAHRLARASRVRLELDDVARAIAPGAHREDGLSGGEDYVLLFTAPDVARTDAIKVGRVLEGEGVWSLGVPVEARGYDHFASVRWGV